MATRTPAATATYIHRKFDTLFAAPKADGKRRQQIIGQTAPRPKNVFQTSKTMLNKLMPNMACVLLYCKSHCFLFKSKAFRAKVTQNKQNSDVSKYRTNDQQITKQWTEQMAKITNIGAPIAATLLAESTAILVKPPSCNKTYVTKKCSSETRRTSSRIHGAYTNNKWTSQQPANQPRIINRATIRMTICY